MKRPLSSLLPLVLAAALAGCLPAFPRVAEPPAAPTFDVDAFFAGETRGLGVLRVRGRQPVEVRVASRGERTGDGSLRLTQTIRLGSDAPYGRTWTFRPIGDGRYTGALSEAVGPVEAVADGPTLRIRYRTGRFTTVSQTLTLQPGGRVALNLLSVRVLGVPVARLTEQIRRDEG